MHNMHIYTYMHPFTYWQMSSYLQKYLHIQFLVSIQKRNSMYPCSANHIRLYIVVYLWLALFWWYLFWCVVDVTWNLAPCESLEWPDFPHCWYSCLLRNHWNFLHKEQMEKKQCYLAASCVSKGIETESPELEETHKVPQAQLLALHRTAPRIKSCAWQNCPNISWTLSVLLLQPLPCRAHPPFEWRNFSPYLTSNLPLIQLHALPSDPVTGHKQEEVSACLSAFSCKEECTAWWGLPSINKLLD